MRQIGSSITRFAMVGGLLGLLVAGCGDGNGKADASDETPQFDYAGDAGPGFWGELTPQWENCSTDTRQSPIDISDATVDPDLEPLALDLHGTPLKIFNNGHTIQQEYEGETRSPSRVSRTVCGNSISTRSRSTRSTGSGA